MAEIRGGKAKERIAKEFYINEAEAATVVSNVVSPVFDVGKDQTINLIRFVVAGSAGMYTSPTDRDFYLSSITISIAATGKSGVSYGYVQIYDKSNYVSRIFQVNIATGAADSAHDTQSITFPVPILLRRGYSIAFTVQDTDAQYCCITGIIKESPDKTYA